MLSRSASNLYWMGRYLERASFLCRLIDATLRLSSLPASHGGADAAWESAVKSAAVSHAFGDEGLPLSEDHVAHYLALSPDNSSSIRSCLEKARLNGRAVRTSLTLETWEAVNGAWLEILRFGTGIPDSAALMRLIDSVSNGVLMYEGAAHRSQLRESTYWFMRLGTAIERADNTARLLDVKYHLLLPRTEKVGGSLDYFQWTTLLRTVSALSAYRWVYRDAVKPWLVADLLILQRAMPRSLTAPPTAMQKRRTASCRSSASPPGRMTRSRCSTGAWTSTPTAASSRSATPMAIRRIISMPTRRSMNSPSASAA